MTKPFLKWAGGKRQLLPELQAAMPAEFNRYFEPFLGGAALYFDQLPAKAYLSDINEELINCYQIVRDKPASLCDDLAKHIHDKAYFLSIRNLDRDKIAFAKLSQLHRASRFIYLNRTGFNGMYRVNRKGEFNIPFGRYKSPNIVNRDGIFAASEALQGAHLVHQSYQQALAETQAGDFVYLDPPYMPVSSTAHFTSYAKGGFGFEEQRALADACRQLDERGVYFLASNSFMPEICELYRGFSQKKVSARRSINSVGSARQAVAEILIANYQLL